MAVAGWVALDNTRCLGHAEAVDACVAWHAVWATQHRTRHGTHGHGACTQYGTRHAARGTACGAARLEVCVLEHNVRIGAAELEQAALQVLPRLRSDRPPGTAASRQRDGAHRGVGDDCWCLLCASRTNVGSLRARSWA